MLDVSAIKALSERSSTWNLWVNELQEGFLNLMNVTSEQTFHQIGVCYFNEQYGELHFLL